MASEASRAILDVVLILVAANLGGELAQRLRQPAVLGELVAGLLLGAGLLGGRLGLPDFVAGGGTSEVVALLASLGAILLLFEVGLESDLRELAKVGASSIVVALLGIVVSFVAGFAASYGLAQFWEPWRVASDSMPAWLLHLFVGATLTATSVGITARVLGDMGQLRSSESRIILGAAVLDDIGGLLILAIVAALAASALSGEPLGTLGLLKIAGTAVGFLIVSLLIGIKAVPWMFDRAATKGRSKGFAIGLAFAFALAMSWLAAFAGLAEIVGAFVAGLLLAPAKARHHLVQELRGVATLLVGFFFVTLGMRADVTQLEGYGAQVVLIGVALALLATVAKLSSGLGVLGQAADRLVVGIGMVPRGEVGLIFAALGLSVGIVANWQYTALLLVVLLTTFITPPWLQSTRARFTPEGTTHAPPDQHP